MTSARPLFLVPLVVCVAAVAFAADDGSKSQASAGSLQNQTPETSLFADSAQNFPDSSGLLFRRGKPRLSMSPIAARPESVASGCLTMRMYKVKRRERLAENESASRGYTTCEPASNYQMRTAIAHVRSGQEEGSRNNEPQK